MDTERARKLIANGNQDSSFIVNKTQVSFARAGEKDIDRITQLSNQELIQEWKGMYQLIFYIECSSIRDMQILSLLELELEARKQIDKELLREYIKKQDLIKSQGGYE